MEFPEAAIDKFFTALLVEAKPLLLSLPASPRKRITDLLIQISLSSIMQFITRQPVKPAPDWVGLAVENWQRFPSKYLN